jgi:hypothetical protein
MLDGLPVPTDLKIAVETQWSLTTKHDHNGSDAARSQRMHPWPQPQVSACSRQSGRICNQEVRRSNPLGSTWVTATGTAVVPTAGRPVIPYDPQIAQVWGELAGAAQLRGPAPAAERHLDRGMLPALPGASGDAQHRGLQRLGRPPQPGAAQ